MEPQLPEFDRKYETDIRCGRSAEKSAKKTQTATIIAGTSGSFVVDALHADVIPPIDNNRIFHGGPGIPWRFCL